MSHGYEDVGVVEIREKLRAEFGVTDPATLKQTKKALIALLQEKMKGDADEEEINNIAEEEDSILVYSDPQEVEAESIDNNVVPHINSPNWQEYILRQFHDEELKDGNPTCDGCRRVVEEFLGPILSSGVSEYTPANINNKGTATVVYNVSVLISNESHPLYDNTITIVEIADAGQHNTVAPYCNHAAATAATRAEGRCYRKLLRLRNTITAEEYSERADQLAEGEAWTIDDPIDDNQISIIDLMCKRLDIDIMSFMNSGQSTYPSIEFVTKSTAQKMLQELNKIQRGVREKSTLLGNYDPEWRNVGDE